ncbi:MAG TPA: Crp/Fnr family transcriptional regulator [Vicinamibacterales bacterium]|jgi:CRP-like cAMP-binding protein|nr:Crp/Fnr family transcriptional regulator [Vicinamibacterales bacterium]
MASKPLALNPATPSLRPFDLSHFLDSSGIARRVTKYARGAVIFSQGDAAEHVYYIQKGSVKVSVLSRAGKEAVVGMLGVGSFFGEGCLAAQPRRMATATALTATTLMVVEKPQMLKVLHDQPALADRFIEHMLARNIRIEEDLIDQLFNSSEKRLARALLLLARYGTDTEQLLLPKISQDTLAKMVGTTRSRVNFFMNKFRSLGFIEYEGVITVHRSLLTVVLHD